MAHAFDLGTWKGGGRWISELKASLVYSLSWKVSSMTAWLHRETKQTKTKNFSNHHIKLASLNNKNQPMGTKTSVFRLVSWGRRHSHSFITLTFVLQRQSERVCGPQTELFRVWPFAGSMQDTALHVQGNALVVSHLSTHFIITTAHWISFAYHPASMEEEMKNAC